MNSWIKGMAAVGGSLLTLLYGGWSELLTALCVFMTVDFITGWVAAGMAGKLSSNVGFKGIARKMSILLIVALGHLMDGVLGTQNELFESACIYFYLANEALSIIENTGRMGLPIPDVLKKAIAVISEKAEKEEER
ncbi:phage holin family protein [Laceyella putida]|uniref:Holin family protein n=1 Tax=Laceyella putida TaxID=110101 RepID=A0ABW2RR80_9BACL